jgi:Ras-related GTP-binding protein C/D
MGTKLSGKTSIRKVVFEKMSPHETIFIESTTKIEKKKIENFGICNLNITEIPFNIKEDEKNNANNIIKNCTTLIYVFDISDSTNSPFEYFNTNILPNILEKSSMLLSIFIHKIDSIKLYPNEFTKKYGDIKKKFNQILKDKNIDVKYYITSIYEYSIFETFSKIIQNTMPKQQSENILNLLTNFAQCCKFDKCYLFDIFYKIYIADDFLPFEEQIYELCSDIIDVNFDLTNIYKENKKDSLFDNKFSCIFNFEDGIDGSKNIFYLRFIDSNFVLIAMGNDLSFNKPHLLEYNINIFIRKFKEIFKK